ncbi:uncharacterized protein LOC115628688 isoform X2 [Scaptodrosophila lebanonensis]|uniref:Uncharacterized protein LOC115628688 isoform X2 n=1 Tax=Drosophila lebanonensis TaxID=7225 RepID=A0A6J2TX72_DROLE|nr:uncharacterized protein LOC115628688 isoform X2 [Scaptodrosophila lebanonensis]
MSREKKSRHSDQTQPIEEMAAARMERHVLKNIVSKLPVSDQLALYRSHKLVPEACTTLWRNTHKRLDFRTVEKDLCGKDLAYFLCTMVDDFKYVYFTAERLQENLNVLEKSGVKALNSVQHCELLVGVEPPVKRHRGNGDQFEGTLPGAPSMAQWPLHALPKLLRNLRRLKVYCDVQVHFIEQFPQLEFLVLDAQVSQSALTGVLERCSKLKRIFVKSDAQPLDVRRIGRCKQMQDVSLPVTIFNASRSFIIELPQLQLLELTSNEEHRELAIESMRYVVEHKAADMEIVQLDCAFLGGPFWIRDAELQRCTRLRGLVLINCRFNDREIVELNMPRVHKYLVFSGCHDLKEYQLLDMLKMCPGLCELYLIDCPLLSGKVLQGIYRIRRSENTDFPISVVLSRCNAIRDDYQRLYASYWYFKLGTIKLERMAEENRPIEDIQLFFYKN